MPRKFALEWIAFLILVWLGSFGNCNPIFSSSVIDDANYQGDDPSPVYMDEINYQANVRGPKPSVVQVSKGEDSHFNNISFREDENEGKYYSGMRSQRFAFPFDVQEHCPSGQLWNGLYCSNFMKETTDDY